jgi:hypothetical protein
MIFFFEKDENKLFNYGSIILNRSKDRKIIKFKSCNVNKLRVKQIVLIYILRLQLLVFLFISLYYGFKYFFILCYFGL